MSDLNFQDTQKVCFNGLCATRYEVNGLLTQLDPVRRPVGPCLGGLCGLRPLNPYIVGPWYRRRCPCRGCCSSSSSSSSCCSSSSSSCC